MPPTDTLDLAAQPFYLWDTFVPPTTHEVEFAGLAMIDSVFAERPAAEVPRHPSLFGAHSLAVSRPALQPRPVEAPPAWCFVVAVVLTALVCLYYRVRKIGVGSLLQSVVDSHAMGRMLRDTNLTRSTQMLPMGLLLMAVVALPVQRVLGEGGLAGYLLLVAGLVLAYLLRNGTMRLLGSIFDDGAAVSSYIASNYLYHLLLASLAVPLLFLLLYLPYGQQAVLYLLAGLSLLLFVCRLVRGMKLFLTQSSSPHFYLFYYLCIVELIPILILVKCFVC